MSGLLILAAVVAASSVLRSTAPLVAYVMALLAMTAWRSRRGEHLHLYRQITPGILARNAVMVVVVGAVLIGLFSLGNPVLNYSWYGVLLSRTSGAPIGEHVGAEAGVWDDPNAVGNLLLSPLDHTWLTIPFVLLLAFLLPRLAAVEERIFRLGTRNWLDGALRSTLFGLAHLTMGIPLGAALALSLGGLWFTRQYFLGGANRSTVYHLAYNVVVLMAIVLLLLVPL